MLDFSFMNEEQREAVTWGKAPLLLLAGPGSGKTFTIVNRILYLLEQGVPPEKILVITFTKDAAISMKSRFCQITKKEYPVNFGTFHSIFYHMIQESLGIRQSKLLTNSQKKKIISNVIYQKAGNVISDEGNDISDVAEKMMIAISFFKNTENINKALKKIPEMWKAYFQAVFEGYQKEIKRMNQIDFDDMLYECKKMLEQNINIRAYWQNRFTHILVDEFQDTNPIQYQTLKLMCNSTSNVFVVGDDDQAIYGFRGAMPNVLNDFVNDFEAEQLLLRVNYRSSPEIIESSLAVINCNKNRFVKNLCANPQKLYSNSKNIVVIKEFANTDLQYRYLAEQLKAKAIENTSKNKTCAVLFRTNNQMQMFSVYLEKEGINYSIKEKQVSIYDNFVVKDIMAYLQAAKNKAGSEEVLRILNSPNRLLSREAIKNGFHEENMKSWYKDRFLSENDKKQIFYQIELLFRQLKCMSKMTLPLAIQYIMKAVNYERYLKKKCNRNQEKLAEWLEIVHWLKQDAESFKTIDEWLEFQREYQDRYDANLFMKEKKQESFIHLMTVHASKGLEFHEVYIPDCNEKVYPHGIMPDEETVEEERRLFYVAMTRAKERLELLYLLEEGNNRKQKSRFISEIEESVR